MMQVGNKIKKIRELKNISSKDMAEKLAITVQGYSKIERDEVSLNMERLQQISDLFGMKPEEVLSFDEKYVFNNYGERSSSNLWNVYHNQIPEEWNDIVQQRAQLQEDKIKLLEDKIRYLEQKLEQQR